MEAGKRKALIISSYNYQDPKLKPLEAPVVDADSLVKVLKDALIGGFDTEMLPNATSQQVRTKIEDFFFDAGRDDTLLLYFTGHGVKDPDGNLYLATIDTCFQKDSHSVRTATAVNSSFVNNKMKSSHSRRIILILDCCYSGAFEGTKSGAAVLTGDEFSGTGRIVLTASDAAQYAWQGDDLTGEGGSVFTQALVQGLRSGEADSNNDGNISVFELYRYVQGKIKEITASRKPQTPQLWTHGQKGDFMIARNPRPIKEQHSKKLYDEILQLITQGAWDEAIVKWQQLQTDAPDFPDKHGFADLIKKRERMYEMYDKMQQFVIQHQGQKALQAWALIKKLDSEFPDTKDLVQKAREALDAEERKRSLDQQYAQIESLNTQGRWQDVLTLWQEITRLDPTYEDSKDLALNARRKLDQLEREQLRGKRRQQLHTLYAQLGEQVAEQKWRRGQSIWQEIREIDPTYGDSKGHAAKCAFELDRIEAQKTLQERQRTLSRRVNELSRHMQAKDWRQANVELDAIRKLDPHSSLIAQYGALIERNLPGSGKSKKKKSPTPQGGGFSRLVGRMLKVSGLGLLALVGLCIGLGILGSMLGDSSSTRSSTPTQAQEKVDPSSDKESSFLDQAVVASNTLPENNACPYRADSLWLPDPSITYGPHIYGNRVYLIEYDADGFFYVGDIDMDVILGPFTISNYNVWTSLLETPFQVCIDINLNVFVAFVQ